MNDDDAVEFVNLQKRRLGISRLVYAARYSRQGIRDAWAEPAFRLEAKLFFISLPFAIFIGDGVYEQLLLASSVWVLMIVEILNSAIESAIDRIGLEKNELSRKSKDLGSAAVLMSIILCSAIWLIVALKNFFHY